MRIVVAPDSFKGSGSSAEVAMAIERGIVRVFPDASIRRVPVADGGEGTVEAVVAAEGGRIRETTVNGPLAEPVTAAYGLLPGGRAVIEMAAASGLPLVPHEKRNPLRTTTFGLGELILDALERGCREFLIGIGGSATNDGGIGMAQALGYEFLDDRGAPVEPTGAGLGEIRSIVAEKVDPRLAESMISVACDVQNPLVGAEGASAVYGPQKGADEATVKRLDAGLRNLASRCEALLGVRIDDMPGGGAAGGLGAGLVAFAGAELKSGIDAVLDIIRFDEIVVGSDLVVTGEGAIDGQTVYGKVPVGVAARSGNAHVLAVVGNIGEGAETVYDFGISGIMSTASGAMELDEAMRRSIELIEDASHRLMRFVRVGMDLRA